MLLTADQFVQMFGEEECLQIAGVGPRDHREVDLPRIDDALAQASAMVLGYVRDRWPQAGAGTPMLRGFAADIARWRLRGRGGQASAMNETVQKRYDEAVARLKDIAAGRLTLDLSPPASGAPGVAEAANEQRVISAVPPSRRGAVLEGWR
jgi:phage gp36-like protein